MYLSGKIYAVESERFEFAIHNGLELKNRSLVFSIVQLYDGYHSTKYYFPGIAGPANIEGTDGFKVYTETLDDEACISASIHTYVVGKGDIECPTTDELRFIKDHIDELNENYGLYFAGNNSFNHHYEPEEEY